MTMSEELEYVRHERTFIELYQKWYQNKNYISSSQRIKLYILKSLELLDARYRHLLENKYTYQVYNVNYFLYSIQFMHIIVSKSVSIYNERNPFYSFRPLETKNDCYCVSNYDVSNGRLEEIFKILCYDCR